VLLICLAFCVVLFVLLVFVLCLVYPMLYTIHKNTNSNAMYIVYMVNLFIVDNKLTN
jgi:hypothetical protein